MLTTELYQIYDPKANNTDHKNLKSVSKISTLNVFRNLNNNLTQIVLVFDLKFLANATVFDMQSVCVRKKKQGFAISNELPSESCEIFDRIRM